MTGISVRVEEAELLALTGSDRDAATQGLLAGSEFPFVLVDGILACCGSFSSDGIAEAVRVADSKRATSR
jgi:hypothetical protein